MFAHIDFSYTMGQRSQPVEPGMRDMDMRFVTSHKKKHFTRGFLRQIPQTARRSNHISEYRCFKMVQGYQQVFNPSSGLPNSIIRNICHHWLLKNFKMYAKFIPWSLKNLARLKYLHTKIAATITHTSKWNKYIYFCILSNTFWLR